MPILALWPAQAQHTIQSGSGRPNTEKVGTVNRAQLEEIAKMKEPDLTAADMDAAIILNICAGANNDKVIVTAYRHLIPNAAVCINPHRPNHRRCWRDKGAIINFWHMIKKRRNMW